MGPSFANISNYSEHPEFLQFNNIIEVPSDHFDQCKCTSYLGSDSGDMLKLFGCHHLVGT